MKGDRGSRGDEDSGGASGDAHLWILQKREPALPLPSSLFLRVLPSVAK